MKRSFLVCFLLITKIVSADQNVSTSFQGYSGLINIPTADLLKSGEFDFSYTNQVETRNGYREGTNYLFGLGLWKQLEVSARLADYNFGGENGLTDLSANVKFAVPYIPKEWFSLALGIQDLGGAANFFDAKYIVASKNIFKNIQISAGVGKSASSVGKLNGAFGGVSWQPYEWIRTSVEYDAANTNVGIQLLTPKRWFNNGMQFTTNILAYRSGRNQQDKFYYGVGVKIPLNNLSVSSPAITHSSTINQEMPLDVIDRSGTLERIQLKKRLIKEGFESIKIGESTADSVYVELQNHSYNRNQLDAIGIALAAITKQCKTIYKNFKFVLKEQNIPILVVKGDIADYENFLNGDKKLAIDISTNTYNAQNNIYFPEAQQQNSLWLKPRFTFWPSIVSAVGTEFGILDTSLALVTHLELPLWRGAAVSSLYMAQFAETQEFKDGQQFADWKQKTGLQEYSLHQTFSLPLNLKNMFSLGRYRSSYNYLANDMVWQSPDGAHRINLRAARYENQIVPKREHYQGCNIFYAACWKPKEPINRNVLVASYRYYFAALDSSFEVGIGQYWQQDKGITIQLKRLFGDISVNLNYKNTKLANQAANQFVGIGFTIPLTPRKDYSNKYFQVRGRPNWSYSVNTLVGKSSNNLTPGTADSAQLFYNLSNNFYNQDRLNSEYIYRNAQRLKEVLYL